MVVGTIGWNRAALLFNFTPSKARLHTDAHSAGSIGFAAGRNGNAGPSVRTPGFASGADTSTAVVVVVGTLLGDSDTIVQNRTMGVLGLERDASTATVVGSAALGNPNAFVGGAAKCEAGVAGANTLRLVGGWSVSVHAVAALVTGVRFVGGFVFVAEIDLREACLEVFGDQKSRGAKLTDLLNEVDLLTISNGRHAPEGIGGNVIALRAGVAREGLR